MATILEDIINTHVEAYIEKVAKTFNIPSKSLKNIWYNKQGPIIIMKFKNLDCYWHNNGNFIIKLDKKDKNLCKKWNFQIDI